MSKLLAKNYSDELSKAVAFFWNTREAQKNSKRKSDQGNRSAVTGGKQMDGFIELFTKIATDIGIPQACIFTKRSTLPGFFRPTKNWDFLIISPTGKLITVLEFKSHVGSFGNNFNNRTEEALGSALDLWTAFREKSFPQVLPPWVGYLMLAEKTDKSNRPINIRSPHFPARKEFSETSYLDRYLLLCQKLMLEKHYSATCLIWSESKEHFGFFNDDISFDAFVNSFIGSLYGKLNEFNL